MVTKTDREKLVGILEKFDQQFIEQALSDYREGKYAQKSYKDFADPGDEVELGEDAHVEMADLPANERIIVVAGGNNLLPAHFLEEGAVVQGAVARIVVPGKWHGTGFMVSQSLFLTNNHVLPSASLANTAQVEFNYQLDQRGCPQTVIRR